MKKSALKEYIREEIIKTLSEEMNQASTIAEKKEEDDVEIKDDYYKVDDEDDVKPIDAPAGDKEIQKKATKADIIIKTYKDLNQMLQRYKEAFLNAENETKKAAAFKIYKDFSQGDEYQNAKKKYVALKTIEL